MEKTKLGISVGLTAAILYFLGLINVIALVLAAGFVLFTESNTWLKKSAVQAVVITVFFSLVGAVLGVGTSLFSFLNGLLGNFIHTIHIGYPLNIQTILVSAATILQDVLLLILGFMALGQKGPTLPLISDFVDKHMGVEKPKPAAPVYPQQPVQVVYQQPVYQQPVQQAQPQQPAAPVQPPYPQQPAAPAAQPEQPAQQPEQQ